MRAPRSATPRLSASAAAVSAPSATAVKMSRSMAAFSAALA
jgi:hypothetical protein